MQGARLNLVVLRVADLERAAAFYRAIGLAFEQHSHGSGPVHFAAFGGAWVFELYLATAEHPSASSARVGFAVRDVDAAVERAAACVGGRVVSVPKASEWGRRAVLSDPDGHRVELTEDSAGT